MAPELFIRRHPAASYLFRLRQVVAKRGPYHVVHAFGRNARSSSAVAPGPAKPLKVGVLNTPANAAFGSLDDPVPEAKASLCDETSVTRTGTAGRRSKLVAGRVFRAAFCFIGKAPT